MTAFSESVVEEAALEWLAGLGYSIAAGPTLAPGEPTSERADFATTFLEDRLRAALASLNPTLPIEAIEDAFRKLTRLDGTSLVVRNHHVHRMLVNGVDVEYKRADGSIAGTQAKVFDFDDPDNNNWLAVNQFTVIENKHNRRPDVVIFVNGLPLGLIELKNAADEEATVWSAFNQLQTYKLEIPSIFDANAVLVISDGTLARVGSLTADRERFMPWRTTDGEEVAPKSISELQVLLEGVFEKRRFLQMLRHFTVFEQENGGALSKKIAGYHQFHAVNQAVQSTIRASGQSGSDGDGRVGVVWHTQGSGKSLTMAFYAGRVILSPEMENPTLVVLTDRNDLDDQLFGTFARCSELLRQQPMQATSRDDLSDKLRVDSGGVVFTTIQKFFQGREASGDLLLSDRHNIVVIADEAHRSQYDFIDGYARHMRDALPNASFIGFTGTPLDGADASTRSVFGDYISIYDIQRAVEDKATVPIYYESRLAKLSLDEAQLPTLDADFEEVTEGEETSRKEKLKSKWARLEAIVGSQPRIELIAKDLIEHFEQRTDAMAGKGMIVCMSRRICVELYDELVRLRPEWHSDDDGQGALKVVMTGSAPDPLHWQQHIRPKRAREDLANRFRDSGDEFNLVIVRDMWLTGFDAPSMHTMYIDKPMHGHSLMQAIARVNRVFRDKPGGLVVDYLGFADELRKALATYTEEGGQGDAAVDQAEAVAVMQEKYEICCGIFHGFDWSKWVSGTPGERTNLPASALEHVLAQEDGRARLIASVGDLSKAFALAVPADRAIEIRDDVAFFQTVRAAIVKSGSVDAKSDEELDLAVRQIVSNAVAPDGVVDIFDAAGLKKPDLHILSDQFLAQVRDLPHKNLAVEMLRRLIAGETKARARKNVVEARAFSDRLDETMRLYQNKAIEAAIVIEELIKLAEAMREAAGRGEELGLTDDELAFYDALADNSSAAEVMGDEQLAVIARELVESVRRNVSIDWTVRESVRAKLRVTVKRILRKYGYPPDLQEKATDTVLQQAELLSADWSLTG